MSVTIICLGIQKVSHCWLILEASRARPNGEGRNSFVAFEGSHVASTHTCYYRTTTEVMNCLHDSEIGT